MEEFTVSSDNLVLRGWLSKPTGGNTSFPTVIICHGIPSGASPDPTDPGYPALMEKVAERGMAAVHFNFRGTGASEGNFSLGGWLRDLERVVDAVLYGREPFGESDAGRLGLLAFSGGAAVGINCAARHHHLAAIASLASPADLTELLPRERLDEALGHWRGIGIIRDPAFPPDPEAFYREIVELSPLRHVANVAPAPLLLAHGGADDVVPVNAANRLYEAAEEPKELWVLPGAGHRLRLVPEAMQGVLGWLQKQLARA